MLEVKTLKVDGSKEESTVELMQNFGWNFVSSQEVNNTDSHLERQGDTLYSVTTKEKYVKLVFNREKNQPNYSKIVALENEYYSVLKSEPLILSKVNSMVAFFLLCFFIVPGVIYIWYVNKNRKEEEERHARWAINAKKRTAEILNEAAALVG